MKSRILLLLGGVFFGVLCGVLITTVLYRELLDEVAARIKVRTDERLVDLFGTDFQVDSVFGAFIAIKSGADPGVLKFFPSDLKKAAAFQVRTDDRGRLTSFKAVSADGNEAVFSNFDATTGELVNSGVTNTGKNIHTKDLNADGVADIITSLKTGEVKVRIGGDLLEGRIDEDNQIIVDTPRESLRLILNENGELNLVPTEQR